MSGTDRLVEGEATDFERELLGTWTRRQPSDEARARALAIAGAGVGAALLTTAGATAVKAASTSIAPKAATLGSAMLVKWIAVGLLGATATAGAVAYVRHETRAAAEQVEAPSPGVPSKSASTAPGPATAVTRDSVEATAEDPAASIELGPETQAPARPRAPAATQSSTLDEEVALIGQARAAVTGGDGRTALQLVSAYDAKYGGGAGIAPGDGRGKLSQESTEIRIEALVLQGNRAAAERLAAKFLTSHPSSPYVRHIRALVGETKTP